MLCLGMALSCIWLACKDTQTLIPSGSINWPGEKVKASFAGKILDETGKPVAGAVVQVGPVQANSDDNGVFIIKDVEVNSSRAIVTLSKTGYWTAHRTLFVRKNSQNTLLFTLLEKKLAGSFVASSGGTINVPGGTSINFNANSISKNGQPYSGNVNVVAHWIDPFAGNLYEALPGDLRGIRNSGQEEQLFTYGMLGVELSDDSGQLLEVSAGKTVEISAEIDNSLLASAPASIPLWHFDETEGLWVEEGSAQKTGNRYVGQVSHFSWWNYDASAPAVKISGRIVDPNGNPLSNVHVWACPSNIQPGIGCGHGMVDADGYFCGLATKDVELKITVQMYGGSGCDNTLGSVTVGPFAADTDLGNIVIDPNGTNSQITTVSVSGSLRDCNDQPVSSGYVLFENLNVMPVIADAQGNFTATFSICDNATPSEIQIRGIDANQAKESGLLSLPFSTSTNFGPVQTCTNLDEYIRYSLDGAPFVTMTAFADSSFANNSANIYGYDPVSQATIYLSWMHNNVPANNLPLSAMTIQGIKANENTGFNVQTDMTSYPLSVGEYLSGDFGGSFLNATTGQTHNISGAYRVKRQ